MAEIKTQVRITEKELKEIVCKLYNLDLEKATVRVNHLPGNQHKPEYNEIIIESVIYKNTIESDSQRLIGCVCELGCNHTQ